MVKAHPISIKVINVVDMEHIIVVVQAMVVEEVTTYLVVDSKILVKVKVKIKEEIIIICNVDYEKSLVH